MVITCEGGGNNPAVAVPLVALGTQSGTIDVIDVSANAVAASFSVHNGVVRGLRWLGNSRLVSFSYVQVYDISFVEHIIFSYFSFVLIEKCFFFVLDILLLFLYKCKIYSIPKRFVKNTRTSPLFFKIKLSSSTFCV